MSSKGKKKGNRDVTEEDVFQVGRIKEHWVNDYSNVDVKSNEKEKIGEQKIFYVLCTKQTTENGEINVYSAIPKQWISSNFKSLLYPPNEAVGFDPSTWNEKLFNRNIWPMSSWMEYDVDKIFNEDNCPAKKARDLQNGTVLPENWFDSDKNLGRSKNGDVRSLRRISNQQKRSIVQKNAGPVEITTSQAEKPTSQRTKASLKSLHFPPSSKRRKTASVGASSEDFDAQDDPLGNNSDSESLLVQNSARKNESLSFIVESDSEADDGAGGKTDNLEAEQVTEPLSVGAQNVSERTEGSASTNSLSTPAGDPIADLDLPVSTVVSPIINSDDYMKALENILERVVQRQLQPFRKLVLKEFAKIHARLDQVYQPNAIENASRHLVYHAQKFQQQFVTLPCDTLEEVKALNTMLRETQLAVTAVCHLADKYKSSASEHKFLKLVFRVFISDELCDKMQWRPIMENGDVRVVGLYQLHNLLAVIIGSGKRIPSHIATGNL
ncbi:hypothetical protein OUZ56_024124 [Daphnia magna]|uniref:Uncharacterized protein n=1 Tax=Daphnia magna TaxID=35525 RepID=A0ABR0B074_9CRUS|nr:hypothetical protein OUZ56_024124 [Daphnia magna]